MNEDLNTHTHIRMCVLLFFFFAGKNQHVGIAITLPGIWDMNLYYMYVPTNETSVVSDCATTPRARDVREGYQKRKRDRERNFSRPHQSNIDFNI